MVASIWLMMKVAIALGVMRRIKSEILRIRGSMVVGLVCTINKELGYIDFCRVVVPLKLFTCEVPHTIQMGMDLFCQCNESCRCPDLRRQSAPLHGRQCSLSTVQDVFLVVL